MHGEGRKSNRGRKAHVLLAHSVEESQLSKSCPVQPLIYNSASQDRSEQRRLKGHLLNVGEYLKGEGARLFAAEPSGGTEAMGML